MPPALTAQKRRCALAGRLVLPLLAVALALGSSQAEARLGAGIEVVESDESGITLEVRVDTFDVSPLSLEGRDFHLVQFRDFLTTQEEGLPRLPYTSTLVGIPFESTPRVRVLENVTAVMPGVVPAPAPRQVIRDGEFPTPGHEFVMDQVFYSGRTPFPELPARLGEPATMRHQRVVSVFLFPFQYDPASKALVYSERLVVRVDFVESARPGLEQSPERKPGSGGEDQAGPSTAPETPAVTRREPAPSFELYSEGLYEGLIVNYEQARHWREKPVSGIIQTPLPVAQAVSEYKIAVDSTGVYRVSYAGIPGASPTYPVSQVRLFEKFYQEGDPSPFKQVNVPIDVFDTNSNGLFDGSDYFAFYGLAIRDRFPSDVMEQRYSYENVYWLTLGGSDGLQAARESSWRTAPAPLEPASFLHVQKFEKDSLYLDFASRIDCDYYLWNLDGPPSYQAAVRFFVYAPDTTKAWRIRARYQGFLPALHYVTMILDNSRGVTDTLLSASFGPTTAGSKAEIIMDTGFNISDSLLASGQNFFRYAGEREVFGTRTPGSGSFMDWFEVSYYRKFVAQQGKLAFTSGGLSGELQFTLEGFPTSDILLYDVTDSLNPVRLTIEPFQVTFNNGSYSLVFRDSVGTELRRYQALSSSAARPVRTVALDSPSLLASSGAGKDYFIVTYDGFEPALSPLISQREAQGHNVELARLTDVFDEFNGGRRSPTAIRRYLKHAFTSWGTPLFVLLVGDASKDYKDVLPYSSPDFLPTYIILSPVAGPTGRELVGSDHWYVAGLDGTVDDYPDMYIGRIPAGSVGELSAFVQKTIAYEAFSPGDAFRGRGLFVSDDAYSGTDWVNECYSNGERVFRNISLAARNTVVSSPAYPGFDADTLFLSAYLDTVPSTPKPNCVRVADMQQYTRQNVTPELISRLSDGSLFVNYQGHANRFLITHEYVMLANARSYGSDDVLALGNYGKPALWTAFSCHFNNYEEESEDNEMVGDCIGEKLLLQPSTGAIGVFASNAFEFLPLSIYGDMNMAMYDAFFGSPPTSDLRGKRGARWVLGEIVGSGEVRFLAGDYSNKFSVKTHTLLGDPGLKMDALPPQFAVSVNGASIQNGSAIFAASEDDSVRIQALMNDEVAVDGNAIWIQESGPDGLGVVPKSDYQVVATADTVLGASRRFSLYYPTTLRPGTYDIELHATDVNNRESVFALRAALNVSFTDVTGGQSIPLRDGAFVPSRLRLRASVSSPVILSEGDLRFLVDGQDSTAAASIELVDPPGGRHWRIEAELGLTDGEHEFAVVVGDVERSVSVNVASGFAMRRVFVYPSPFERVTSFNYELTGTPSKVEIEVFTVSGRKLVQLAGSVRVGENSVIWEGTDAEGDRVANGLYVYRITATDSQGNEVSKLDKLVKVE